MTQDEIIEMLKEADLDFLLGDNWMLHDELEAFANLVASAEREACAKIVEESSLPDRYSQECMPDIANDIRARGQA